MSFSEQDLAIYEKVSAALCGVVTSDLMALKRAWELYYEEILTLDKEDSLPLFKSLIGLKDFFKEKCATKTMEEYQKQRRKAAVVEVVRKVWRKQLVLLLRRFEEGGDKNLIAKIDKLRARLLVFAEQQKGLEIMARKFEIEAYAGGFQLIEVSLVEVEAVIGSFDTQAQAEAEMQQILIADMQKDPENFGL